MPSKMICRAPTIMRTSFTLLAFLLPFIVRAKDAPEAILKQLPQTIAGCERDEIEDYGDPRLGCSIPYRMAGLAITVYVYDQGRPQIADGITDPFITQSFEMAKKEILRALQKGSYSDVQSRSEGKAMYGNLETLCARYYLTRAQGPDAGVKLFSEIHIFGARDHLIKLRVSGESTREAELGKVVEQFIPELMKAIKPVQMGRG